MKKDETKSVQQIDQSFLEKFVGKKCLISLLSGHHVSCTLTAISDGELLVEEGTQNGKPIEKLIFRQGVSMIEPR